MTTETRDTKYNGWTNYRTWVTKLWLDNTESDQELQREWLKIAQDTPKNDVWTKEETIRFTLADIIKDYLEEANPVTDASLWSDLMRSAIQDVNFQEIADAIIEDYKEVK